MKITLDVKQKTLVEIYKLVECLKYGGAVVNANWKRGLGKLEIELV